jgi:hypothetical protein
MRKEGRSWLESFSLAAPKRSEGGFSSLIAPKSDEGGSSSVLREKVL